jgi:hypothetical protein
MTCRHCGLVGGAHDFACPVYQQRGTGAQAATAGPRQKQRHELKAWADVFHDLSLGVKRAEIRRCDDREFRRGDELLFREYAAGAGAYTGRALLARVTHLVRWAGDLELHGIGQAAPPATSRPAPIPVVVMSIEVLEIGQYADLAVPTPAPAPRKKGGK